MNYLRRRAPAAPGLQTAARVTLIALCAEAAHTLLVIPLLQTYLPNQLHWTPAFPGYVLTAYGSTRLVIQAPAGRMVDRVGPRRCALTGLSLLLVAGVCFAIVRVPVLFLGVACLYGVGAALLWPSLFTVVADRYGKERRGRLAAAIQVAEALGVAAGLGIGAFTVDHAGYTAGFAVYLAFIAAALLALLSTGRLPDLSVIATKQTQAPAPAPAGFHRTPLSPSFLALAAMGALLTLAPNLLTPIVRAFAVKNLRLQLHELIAPFVLVAGIGLLTMIVAGAASDRLGRLPVTLGGLCAGAAGVWLLGDVRTLGFAIAAAAVGAAGYLVTQPAWSAAVLDASSADHRGTQFGIIMIVQGLAESIAPALGGKLTESMGPGAAFHLAGLALGLAAAIAAGRIIWMHTGGRGDEQPVTHQRSW